MKEIFSRKNSLSVKLVSYQVFGRAYSKDESDKVIGSDVGDLIRNYPEDGALFIVTKRYYFEAQKLSYECGDPCQTKNDCPSNPPYEEGFCTQAKKCKQLRWCPTFSKLEYKAIDLYGIEEVLIKFRAVLNLDATVEERSQTVQEITMTLKEIAALSGESWGKLRNVGGVFLFRIILDCTPTYSCSYRAQVTNIEKAWKPISFDKTKIAYYVEDALVYKDKNEQARELNLRVGIKLYLEANGVIKSFDFVIVVKKVCFSILTSL
eukprot:TRINITY_DN2936_c0_g1_i7.p1 TRINITY_DN2936_c0_g1~~TRINITY_DN2936_c0_g1_i7.p1  ORF type:complete len:264 (+),score=14.85 TRINITY_DN2936_c0_g1_i7:275-1066(+)